MVKVLRHGSRRTINNPVTGQPQETVVVVFVENDRGGDNGSSSSLVESSNALSIAVGEDVGLAQIRSHSQSIPIDKLGFFPVGREFPDIFINRKLYSFPQMPQQQGVPPRMVDGSPTYFTSELSTVRKDDENKRIPDEKLIMVAPEMFLHAQVGAAVVNTQEGPSQHGMSSAGFGLNSSRTANTYGKAQNGGNGGSKSEDNPYYNPANVFLQES